MKKKGHFIDWASVTTLSLIVMIISFLIPCPSVVLISAGIFIISCSIVLHRDIEKSNKESGGSIFDDYGYL